MWDLHPGFSIYTCVYIYIYICIHVRYIWYTYRQQSEKIGSDHGFLLALGELELGGEVSSGLALCSQIWLTGESHMRKAYFPQP